MVTRLLLLLLLQTTLINCKRVTEKMTTSPTLERFDNMTVVHLTDLEDHLQTYEIYPTLLESLLYHGCRITFALEAWVKTMGWQGGSGDSYRSINPKSFFSFAFPVIDLTIEFFPRGNDLIIEAVLGNVDKFTEIPMADNLDLDYNMTIEITVKHYSVQIYLTGTDIERQFNFGEYSVIPDLEESFLVNSRFVDIVGSRFNQVTLLNIEREERKPLEEDDEVLKIELCKHRGFMDCNIIKLNMSIIWSEYKVYSFRIENLPDGHFVGFVSDQRRLDEIKLTRVSADSDLSDGAPQYGMFYTRDNSSYISEVFYGVLQEFPEEATEEPSKEEESATEKPPPESIVTVPMEKKNDTSYEEVQEVKDLIDDNVIDFEDFEDNEVPEKKIKIYRPKFNGTKIPIKKAEEKAKEYQEHRESPNLLGFLTFNGFTSEGMIKKNEKADLHVEEIETEISEEVMRESIKAFQRFNGFPETGEITEDQAKVMTHPRCGNRDTSFKDEHDTFLCVEGTIVSTKAGEHGIKGRRRKSPCDIDPGNSLDICREFPKDGKTIAGKTIDDFVKYSDYYFEMDFKVGNDKLVQSHLGILFNYDKSSKRGDYVIIQCEKRFKRLCIIHGEYLDGRRKVTGSRYCKHYLKDEEVLGEFKIRLTVRELTNTASIALRGGRVNTFDITSKPKSNVIIFTYGGIGFNKQKVTVLTSRLCRHRKQGKKRNKRWTVSGFRWYPADGPIFYTFTNYSSSLSPENTRREVLRALETYASYGLSFREVEPTDSSRSDIVFMFMKKGRHAGGLQFYGAGAEKAHAYVPVHGEIHFNDNEKYSIGKRGGHKTSLFYVALHEIGHALGLKHSTLKDAVMTDGYSYEKAYKTTDLDEDDIDALRAHYDDIDITVAPTEIDKEVYLRPLKLAKALAERTVTYQPRLPLPEKCLNGIDAAFYLHSKDRDIEEDTVFLISHGYTWKYRAKNFAMLAGYPKRTVEEFYGLTGTVDAAFFNGKHICFIVGGNIHFYEHYSGIFTFIKEETVESVFGITNTIKAAFNHGVSSSRCKSNKDTCIKTTLVYEDGNVMKRLQASWVQKGKVIDSSSIVQGYAKDIIGEDISSHSFNAAFEHTHQNSGETRVMYFDNGPVCRSRLFYPGRGYVAKTGVFNTPTLFKIFGWCSA